MFCNRDFRSYVKANDPKVIASICSQKFLSIRNSLSDVVSAPLFVAAVSFFVACVEFQVGVLAPEESLGVKSSPARIDNSAFLRLLFCLHKKSLEIHR